MTQLNTKIIEQFSKLVEQIEYDMNNAPTEEEERKNFFRLRQIKNALKILKNFKSEIKSGNDLKGIKGIGPKIMARIDEILKKGKLKEVTIKKKEKGELKKLENLEEVIGIGRKNALSLVRNYGISSVDELKKAIAKGKIRVNDKVKLGLKYFGVYQPGIPRDEMVKIEKLMQKTIAEINPKLHGQICGSYRRKKPLSNDADFLFAHKDMKTKEDVENAVVNYMRVLVDKLHEKGNLLDDLTDKNIVKMYRGFFRLDKNSPVRRLDIKFVPEGSYPTALLHLTGSGGFNQRLRQKAGELGFKLSEYGLYQIVDKKKRLYKRVRVNSEKDVFEKLGMEYIPPENRE